MNLFGNIYNLLFDRFYRGSMAIVIAIGILCIDSILFGIATNGGVKTILNFVHIPSLIVTMGGALFAVMITSDSELTKDILESEMDHKYENAKKQIQFWQDLGSYAPAWGMVGTLLGLINMMKAMGDDPSVIGAGMSLALITTLYGSVIANWICIPIARRLSKKSDTEYLVKEIIIEGVLAIQAGDNPRIIKEKIKALIVDEDDNAVTKYATLQ